VTISDNDGNTEVLNEKSPGNYLTSSLLGVPGRTYSLSVNIDGQTYNASSTMPYPVSIDSIYFAKSPFGKDKLLTVKFLDPADTINYYRLVEFIDNELQQRFSIVSDRLYQGNPIIFTFSAQDDNDEKLVTGDQITVWLESMIKMYTSIFAQPAGMVPNPPRQQTLFQISAMAFWVILVPALFVMQLLLFHKLCISTWNEIMSYLRWPNCISEMHHILLYYVNYLRKYQCGLNTGFKSLVSAKY